jgi:hypothetical protein
MAAFREQRDRDSTQFLREMAGYFAGFRAGPANTYRRLFVLLRELSVPATWVTTNYDLLIEYAAGFEKQLLAYHGRPVPDGNVPLLKIHGSCHFLPDTGTNRLSGVTFANNGSNLEAPIKIAKSADEVLAFCRDNDSFAPAVALYAPGKKVLFCPSAVKQQQDAWLSELSQANAVFIIGLRVLPEDDHIWGALAKASAPLHYVGYEPDEFSSWARSCSRNETYVLAKDFSHSLTAIRHSIGRLYRSRDGCLTNAEADKGAIESCSLREHSYMIPLQLSKGVRQQHG